MIDPPRRWPATAAVALLTALALSAGCARPPPKLDPMDLIRPELDVEQERELGYRFDKAMQQQVHVIDDPQVAGFVNDLGRALLAGAGKQPHVYRFRVIDQDSLNAFALFGGYVYFHSATLLAAGSLDELAGVMGHEIGHVKLRHHARMEKETQLPKLLTTLAGIAGTVATGEPALMMASQGVNVALELHWSRAFEAEADREGMNLVGRAGMRPDAIAHFFERIVEVQSTDPTHIPPYLYSHPDVKERIDTVQTLSSHVEVIPHQNDELRAEFARAKDRLQMLIGHGGAPLIAPRAATSDAETEALLQEADASATAGDHERALALLHDAAARAPDDPRTHFRIGELESEAGRPDAAVHELRRTLEIDPTRALTFFKLGEAYKAEGDAQLAIYAYEQAARRAGAAGTLRARADWEVIKLTFPVVSESGLSSRLDVGSGALGLPVERYALGAESLCWWGRLGPRYVDHVDQLTARWLPPGTTEAADEPLKILDAGLVASSIELPPPGAAQGNWTLELRMQGDVMLRRTVVVNGAPAAR